MNKKTKAWLFIIIGAIPVSIQCYIYIMDRIDTPVVIQSESFYNFYQNYGVGILVFGFFAGSALIGIGMMMLKKEKYLKLSEKDDMQMLPDEHVLLKKADTTLILTITNRRVRFFAIQYKELMNKEKNLPDAEKVDYFHKDIESVRAVTYMDLHPNKLGIKSKWGIQMKLKNGNIVNIPTVDGEEISGQIRTYLGMGF